MLPELQQPNIVGNFLSSYGTAQAQQQDKADRERTIMRQDRADQMQMSEKQYQDAMRRKDVIARAAMALDTPEKWAASVPQVMQSLGVDGPPPSFDQRDRIIAEAQSIGDQIEQQWKQREFGLKERLTNAQVAAQKANAAQSYAAADASRRRATGPGGGGVTIDPETGGLVVTPGTMKPFTDQQSKDIGFLRRAQESNKELSAVNKDGKQERIEGLTNTKDALARAIPVFGRALQSNQSRQGVQTGKSFLAAVLRKDTGAAVTDTEFDYYSDIFLPQWGDDEGTLQLKANARQDFLNGMRAGMTNSAALAQMGIIPPPELAPRGDEAPGAPAPEGQPVPAAGAPQGATRRIRFDANGNMVQ